MYQLIEDRDEISAAQSQLEKTIRRDFKRHENRDIGHPGGTIPGRDIDTDGRHWFCATEHKNRANPSKLNLFGRYGDSGNLNISVEINTPYAGRNGNLAGAFVRDVETGSIYLTHTGRIGGGTPGVGKKRFLAWDNFEVVDVIPRKGRGWKTVLVMPITGSAVTKSAIWYIEKIAQFKHDNKAGKTSTKAFAKKMKAYGAYYSESSGRRRGTRSSRIDYISRHGDVVDGLFAWRLGKTLPRNLRETKTALIDFGILDGETLCELYEVKTGADRSSVYAAIGQLMVHSGGSRCKKFIVLPSDERLRDDLREALKRLEIDIIRYKLTKTGVVIRG